MLPTLVYVICWQVQSNSGSLEEARSTLEDALRLPGVRDAGPTASELTNQDR
jgi:hypothetical protein